jgi:hypothetical protein
MGVLRRHTTMHRSIRIESCYLPSMTGRWTMKKTRYTRSRFRWKMETAIFSLVCIFVIEEVGVDIGKQSRDVW